MSYCKYGMIFLWYLLDSLWYLLLYLPYCVLCINQLSLSALTIGFKSSHSLDPTTWETTYHPHQHPKTPACISSDGEGPWVLWTHVLVIIIIIIIIKKMITMRKCMFLLTELWQTDLSLFCPMILASHVWTALQLLAHWPEKRNTTHITCPRLHGMAVSFASYRWAVLRSLSLPQITVASICPCLCLYVCTMSLLDLSFSLSHDNSWNFSFTDITRVSWHLHAPSETLWCTECGTAEASGSSAEHQWWRHAGDWLPEVCRYCIHSGDDLFISVLWSILTSNTTVGLLMHLQAFLVYAAAVYSNMGNYKSFGDSKFIPNLSKVSVSSVVRSRHSTFICLCHMYTRPQSFTFLWRL